MVLVSKSRLEGQVLFFLVRQGNDLSVSDYYLVEEWTEEGDYLVRFTRLLRGAQTTV